MLGFQPTTATTLENMATLTNQSFFNNNFWSNRLIQSKIISEHGCQVLSKGDNAANWANFWVFLSRVPIIAQHLQGSSNIKALKEQLLKAKDSLNSTLQANMKLAGDNKILEERVLPLLNDAKRLETRALNVEALVRPQYTKIATLRSTLVDANKETKEANVEKERI